MADCSDPPGRTAKNAQPGLYLRQLERVIFISAQKDATIQEQAFAQGAVKFLYEPFSDTALLEALNVAVPLK
jgi:CheY-like chemotaxis protein